MCKYFPKYISLLIVKIYTRKDFLNGQSYHLYPQIYVVYVNNNHSLITMLYLRVEALFYQVRVLSRFAPSVSNHPILR